MSSIEDLSSDINQVAHEKGHYDVPRSFGDQVALMHAELSEALEEHRNGRAIDERYYRLKLPFDQDAYLQGHSQDDFEEVSEAINRWRLHGMHQEEDLPSIYTAVQRADDLDCMVSAGVLKPEGIPAEFADTVIRIFDTMFEAGVDFEDAILEKIAYNASRAYRHDKANL